MDASIIASINQNKNALARLWITTYPNLLNEQKQLRIEADLYFKDRTPVNTKDLNAKKLKCCLKKYDNIFDEAVKLTLIPIGFNQRCHHNCFHYSTIDKDFEPRLGYNVGACKCGNDMCLEIHSVLYHKPTGKFYDITPDYLDETEKWFIPFKTIKKHKEFIYVSKELTGDKRTFDITKLRYGNCKCGRQFDCCGVFDFQELETLVEIHSHIMFVKHDEQSKE